MPRPPGESSAIQGVKEDRLRKRRRGVRKKMENGEEEREKCGETERKGGGGGKGKKRGKKEKGWEKEKGSGEETAGLVTSCDRLIMEEACRRKCRCGDRPALTGNMLMTPLLFLHTLL